MARGSAMAFLKYSFTLALLSGLALSFIIEPNCTELTKPLELGSNHSSIMGKWILAVGAYQGVMEMIGQMMDAYWMELSPPTNDDTFLLRHAYRIGNECTFESRGYSFRNNPSHQPNNSGNIESYPLSSCSNCLTDYISVQHEEEPSRALFLLSRERNVSTSAVDLFKKQAKCLGFPEPFMFYSAAA
ncbi:saxitoxin and tetrodotoxin-binding protein 1-like, partial [Clarias magur]